MIYNIEEISEMAWIKANELISKGMVDMTIDPILLTETLVKLEIEKIEKETISDRNIHYNDEIVDISCVGVQETIDITVSGDNLFYCNGILTKNSIGLPASCDSFYALIRTEELDNLNQLMIKQLKSRYTDITECKRFVLGLDRPKFRLYDVEHSAQTLMKDENSQGSSKHTKPSKNSSDDADIPTMDRAGWGEPEKLKKFDFGKFKI